MQHYQSSGVVLALKFGGHKSPGEPGKNQKGLDTILLQGGEFWSILEFENHCSGYSNKKDLLFDQIEAQGA